MHTVFDTAGIDVPDRVDAWQSVTAASLIPTLIDSPQPEAFTARLNALPLGTAQVTSMTYTSLSSRRSRRSIRISDPEYYQVALIRKGPQIIHQNQNSSILHDGDIVIYDSSQPFEAGTSGTSRAETVVLQFPKNLLALSATQVSRICAVRLPGDNGISRVFVNFLASLTADRTELTTRDLQRLGHAAVDLTTAVLAHQLEEENPPLRSPSHFLYLRITFFIEQNLRDPNLNPATIAAAHQISLRYLHRIFQQHHPTSLNTHIRARRVTRASQELIDPRLRHLTIASIAARWGFTRPADFSRTFYRHTGTSPSQYRHDA